MRTSASQFLLLVDYMERKGDLSKKWEGPNGKAENNNCWVALTNMLNSDATGDTKTIEKWRKVWSDLKNNTKKKSAKIHRAAGGTGGGPALNLRLTELEERVLNIIGPQAATGMLAIPEIGLEEEVAEQVPEVAQMPEVPIIDMDSPSIFFLNAQLTQQVSNGDWNLPGTLSQPSFVPVQDREETQLIETPVLPGVERRPVAAAAASATTIPPAAAPRRAQSPTPPAAAPRRAQSPTPPAAAPRRAQSPTPLPPTPRRARRRLGAHHSSPIHRRTRTQTQSDLARQAFVRSDSEWRAFQQETEQERNRLHEQDLCMQAGWQQLFTNFIALGHRFADILEKK